MRGFLSMHRWRRNVELLVIDSVRPADGECNAPLAARVLPARVRH